MQTPPHAERGHAPLFAIVLLGVVALALRTLNLDAFPNTDEINFWLRRSHDFSNALASGNYADTAISTHPGVTTMWLGSAGIWLFRTLLSWEIISAPTFPTQLAIVRLPIAIVQAMGVVVGYWLLQRLFGWRTAMLAALFWATDPFITALARMLHVDGLATTFATLSILATCVAWHQASCQSRPHRGFLVLSAICAALAVLSKSPALAVLPLTVVVAYWATLMPPDAAPMGSRWQQGRRATVALLLWGTVFLLSMIIIWPAMWAAPARVVALFRIGVEVEGSTGHVVGNFFLGHPDPEPGIAFYPVALAMRMTPWVMVGLGILTIAPLFRIPQQPTPSQWRTIAILAMFIVLITLGLSMFPKKLNRYLVIAFPSLVTLGAIGIMWGCSALTQWLSRERMIVRMAPNVLLLLIVVISVGHAAWWHPHSIAYFNEIFGGAPAGARTFLVGEGDGLGEVAAWLNAQPDITGVVTMSTMVNSLQPYMRRGAQIVSPEGGKLPAQTGYVVVYIRHTQRGPLASPFDEFYPHATPLHTVIIHGVPYAWIYQVPPRLTHTADARFGDEIVLQGYEVDTAAVHASGVISLTLQWHATAPIEQNPLLFLHLLDDRGEVIAQVAVPPAGPDALPTEWHTGRTYTWTHPIPMASPPPDGRMWLSLGLFSPNDGLRLPLEHEQTYNDAPYDGIHTFMIPLIVPEKS